MNCDLTCKKSIPLKIKLVFILNSTNHTHIIHNLEIHKQKRPKKKELGDKSCKGDVFWCNLFSVAILNKDNVLEFVLIILL